MDKRLAANILIDRAEVILTNIVALTDKDRDYFKVPVIDVVVSLETAIQQLQQAQDHVSNITL
ncbi:hypothetical protein [Alteromonas sp. RKMC-009]|uniref:hypothetical protein n=1 Tax=Alteromonas sp. RKMC-009 TaxID=2267264 RepID=UPI000F0C8423|nr:hypothetical protein [Alteromonas sp. RKMC-009]AYN07626.1 hypothetical protein DS731_21765 [Alteromonas sp. RKMC-009]